MGEFLKLVSAAEADSVLARFGPVGLTDVAIEEAFDRILPRPLTASESLPAWPRSRMDGYAVRSADTVGATESLPGILDVVATIRMGDDAGLLPPLERGQCAAVSTGGMLPAGADAVLMLEYAERAGDHQIEIGRPAAVGEHVQRPGEDVRPGARLLEAGSVLRPVDIAMLAAFGADPVKVFRRPVVAIISTGDELVAPRLYPPPGKVRDCNSAALAAQVLEAGAIPRVLEPVTDARDELVARLTHALDAGADVVLVSGGSSVGTRDVTAAAFDALAPDGTLFHGINVRPGRPTLLADVGGVPVLGLPGWPVSSMVIMRRFVFPMLWRMSGFNPLPDTWRVRCVAALSRDLHSRGGREDYVRVELDDEDDPDDIEATPLLGGSAALSSMASADGLICIPASSEGLRAGERVEVYDLSSR